MSETPNSGTKYDTDQGSVQRCTVGVRLVSHGWLASAFSLQRLHVTVCLQNDIVIVFKLL